MKLNINEIVKGILNKRKPKVVALMDEPKKLGVSMVGKKVVKPILKRPRVVAKAKPKYADKKLLAITKMEKAQIDFLMKSNPIEALALNNRLEAKIKANNAPIISYNNLSQLDKERALERTEMIEKAALSLTANLPKVREVQLDINWRKEVLLKHIADVAFKSSLVDDILWIGGGNFGGVLKVKIGATTIIIDRDDMELLNDAATKLWAWSGVLKVLDTPDTWSLRTHLSNSADNYAVSQRKLKSSDWFLATLVEKAIAAPLKYTKETATRLEILAALALATAEVGVSLGFFKDSQKKVNIDCSDNRYGTTQLDSKVMLPYMQSIIDRSSVAGRLTSGNYSSELLTAFTNYLTK